MNLLKVLEPFTKGVTALDSNFHETGTGLFNSDQWTARGAYTLNEKMHAFGRFSRFTDTLSGAVAFGAVQAARDSESVDTATTLREPMTAWRREWILPSIPTLLTDFRLGYYRYNVIDSKHDQTAQFANTLGIPGNQHQ